MQLKILKGGETLGPRTTLVEELEVVHYLCELFYHLVAAHRKQTKQSKIGNENMYRKCIEKPCS